MVEVCLGSGVDVREQILEAATHLLAARGYEGTSVQAVAEAVGIRKASLLYHFPSKEALRQAVLDQLLSHWNEALPRLLRASAQTGVDRFESVMLELVAFFRADTDRARLLMREMLDRPEEMERYLEGYVRPWVEMVAGLIRKGQRTGEIWADVDGEAWVLQVIQLVVGSLATLQGMTGALDANASGAASDRVVRELLRLARCSLFPSGGGAEERAPGRGDGIGVMQTEAPASETE